MPEAFSVYDVQAGDADRWWETFGSEELNALMDQAFADNLTLEQIRARLVQARATAVKARAGLFPELSLESSGSWTRLVTELDGEASSAGSFSPTGGAGLGTTPGTTGGASGSPSAGGGSTGSATSAGSASSTAETPTGRLVTESKYFALGLAASYEVDLWGRVKSQHEAARRDLEASREDLDAAVMTLAAEVAQRWLEILEQQDQKTLLLEQLETNRTYLELVELRFRKSQVSALDVYQQRQTVSEVEAQIPLVEAQERIGRHALALLLGTLPQETFALGGYDLTTVPPLPATGLPAELLAKRPDVKAALFRLQAADWRVASARADRLPAIRLTARAAYQSGQIETLFDNWFVNLAGNLTAPIFDGSRRSAEVERTQAVVRERLAAYRSVVLTAIKEVEDALVREYKHRQHIAALEQRIDYANKSLIEARARYVKGRSDYLPVLTSLATTQRLTRELIRARRELLVFRVNLYRALGGRWMGDLQLATDPFGVDETAKAEK